MTADIIWKSVFGDRNNPWVCLQIGCELFFHFFVPVWVKSVIYDLTDTVKDQGFLR